MLTRNLRRADKLCVLLALGTSLTQVAHVRVELKKKRPNIKYVTDRIHDLRKRIHDELGGRCTFLLTPDQEKAFTDEKAFGQDVFDKFPDARLDVTEAAQCNALGRHTAAVCHLMRVLEVGLKVLAKKLGIPDPLISSNRDWGSMLATIQAEIQANKKTPKIADWHSIHNHVEQAHAFLMSAKGAWRNPTMHVENHYNEGEAASIYGAVHGFMRQVVLLV